MDKTYFLEVDNIFEEYKMSFKFTPQTNIPDITNYAHNAELQFLALLSDCKVEINKHIDTVSYHIEDGEGNNRIVVLDLKLNEGQNSKNHIRDKIGILKELIPILPPTYIHGAENKYWFEVFNITTEFDENKKGVFLFSICIENRDKEGLTYQNWHSHNIMRMDAVTDNNKENISYAKSKGALHFFYMDVHSEHSMKSIIDDIKEGEPYKKQLQEYPEMVF